jgi:glycosidase
MKCISAFICLIILMNVPQAGNAQPKDISKTSNEVIYHVLLRSFFDSDGDQVGDFNGLRQKLDYIQDLGATSIMLLPLYDAECYHNYFADDFEKMDAEFGTFEDYVSLVREIHRRKMKIYMDMETQYVSYKHKWFKSAIGNLSSPYNDYILFDDAAHTVPSTMVFGLRALNSFDGKVIDITTVNLKSKAVLNYNIDLFKYFMDPNKDGKFDDGVDGFRLDHAMDNLDDKPTLTNLFVEFWNPLIKATKQLNPKVSYVAEQADWNDYGYAYFERAGVDRMFGFGLQRAIQAMDKQRLIKAADSVLVLNPAGKTQLTFLENHDLDRFASLEQNLAKQKLAAALQLLMGGIPSIYNGQEIGMKGVGANGAYGNGDGNDIPRREAFEWYKTVEGKGMTLWYKDSGIWWTKTNLKSGDGISVEEQSKDPQSLYNLYKKLLSLRAKHEALSAGAFAHLQNGNDQVFSFVRKSGNAVMVIAANLSASSQRVVFSKSLGKLKPIEGWVREVDGGFELAPYQFIVWEVNGKTK